MTATPESWDDVGGLRLQVHCMSQKVADVEKGLAAFHGLTDSQLQKLKDEILFIHAHEQREQNKERAQEQREQNKERCRMKVCIIIISVLLACALAQLALVDYRHWEEAHETSEKKPTTTWKAVGKKEPEPKHKTSKKKPTTSWKAVGKKEPEPKQTPEAEGRAQTVAESDEEFSSDAKEDAEDEEDKDSGEGDVHEDGEQPKEEPGNKNRLSLPSLPIDLGAALPEDPADGELEVQSTLKSNNAAQDKPSSLTDHVTDSPSLPVRIMSNKSLAHSSPLLQGVFYVCLPFKGLEQSLKKYAPVFNEVLHSQKWGLYPFCYVESRYKLSGTKSGDEDLCDDDTKITFVMEKSRSGVGLDNKHPSSPRIPTDALFENCVDMFSRDQESFKVESPVFFRQILRPDTVIQASLIEEFFNGVYSGKLPEVVLPKRDL